VTSSYRKVLVGLRLSSMGLWLVALGLVLMLSITLYFQVVGKGMPYNPAVVTATNSLLYVGLGLAALGLLVGFVGRCFCLPVPAAAGTAPARTGLAVIFEACSLLSAAGLLLAAYLFPLPSVITLTWSLFAGLTAYFARVQFLRFALALIGHLHPTLARVALAVQRLYLYVPGGLLLALGIAAGGKALSAKPGDFNEVCGYLIAWLIASAATLFAVFMVWRWSELLVGLRKAVATVAELPVHSEDDPDAEYLARYRAAEAGGSS
jgi:hypothetical protein